MGHRTTHGGPTLSESSTFVWPVSPVDRTTLGQDYGQFDWGSANRHHTGLDVSGTNVVAASTGVVEKIFPCRYSDCSFDGDPKSDNHVMQNVVILEHSLPGGGNIYTLYGHLSTIASGVTVGQTVVAGSFLGTTGVWCDRCTPQRTLNHVHFEIKDRPLLHNPTDNGNPTPTDEPGDLCTLPLCYWGYTPTHPDQNGYHDPILLLHNSSLFSGVTVRVTQTGTGLIAHVGPAVDYRCYQLTASNADGCRQLSSGEEFLASSITSATTNCSGGWYQVVNTNGDYFPDLSRGPSTIPDAWICRGNAGEEWVTPVTPTITSPTPGSPLAGTTVTFQWTANGAAVTAWWLYIGSSVGGADLHNSGDLGASLSTTVSGLPTDGRQIFVRLWSQTLVSDLPRSQALVSDLPKLINPATLRAWRVINVSTPRGCYSI